MNVSRLLEFVRSILEKEAKYAVQKRLGKLDARIQEIINAPQQPTHQQEAMTTLQELRRAVMELTAALTPAEWEFLGERGFLRLFCIEMVEEIEAKVASNGITPAVAKAHVADVVARRSKVLEALKAVSNNLTGIGFSPEELKPGEAEVGFTIPRALFANEFGGMVKQLKDVNRIVDVFTEAVLGEWEAAGVGQISTTDPMFLLKVAVPVAVAIGGTVTWLMDTYERTLRIRKLKAESKEVGAPARMQEDYDGMIKQAIEEAIEKRIDELQPKGRKGRDEELENGLRWAMKAILARVERGMRVEVRFLPPPAVEGLALEDAAVQQAKQEEFADLERIQQALNFPIEIVGDPILELPGPAPVKKAKEKPAKKARAPGAPRKKKRKEEAAQVEVIVAADHGVEGPGAKPNGDGALQ